PMLYLGYGLGYAARQSPFALLYVPEGIEFKFAAPSPLCYASRIPEARVPPGDLKLPGRPGSVEIPGPGSCERAPLRRKFGWYNTGRAETRPLHRLREHRHRRPRRPLPQVRREPGARAPPRQGEAALQESLRRLEPLLGLQEELPRGRHRAHRGP